MVGPGRGGGGQGTGRFWRGALCPLWHDGRWHDAITVFIFFQEYGERYEVLVILFVAYDCDFQTHSVEADWGRKSLSESSVYFPGNESSPFPSLFFKLSQNFFFGISSVFRCPGSLSPGSLFFKFYVKVPPGPAAYKWHLCGFIPDSCA